MAPPWNPPPPPPPPHAMIYYGVHKSKFLPQHRKYVIFYKHFINNVFGIWFPHPTLQTNVRLWNEFTKSMNNYLGLTWDFNAPSDKVDFMDLTITITEGQISTSLFEKSLNLHLYIPPHSAPVPVLLPGIAHSTLYLFSLCLDQNDSTATETCPK